MLRWLNRMVQKWYSNWNKSMKIPLFIWKMGVNYPLVYIFRVVEKL